MTIADEISLINHNSEDLVILIEPEGHEVHVRPKQECVIRALAAAGDSRSVRFEFAYRAGSLSVYLMCEKLVLIDGVPAM